MDDTMFVMSDQIHNRYWNLSDSACYSSCEAFRDRGLGQGLLCLCCVGWSVLTHSHCIIFK